MLFSFFSPKNNNPPPPPKLLYSTLSHRKPTQAHNAVWVCCIFALAFGKQVAMTDALHR